MGVGENVWEERELWGLKKERTTNGIWVVRMFMSKLHKFPGVTSLKATRTKPGNTFVELSCRVGLSHKIDIEKQTGHKLRSSACLRNAGQARFPTSRSWRGELFMMELPANDYPVKRAGPAPGEKGSSDSKIRLRVNRSLHPKLSDFKTHQHRKEAMPAWGTALTNCIWYSLYTCFALSHC
ncbi:hypothetical protein RRG08_041755 [Elysia crispata]|uniref:Uncharacterized protein n=1 Tax=Elysia crispata TaxID=231223 RepID=A0AAE0Z026_9GAST|nr:hypothetical protein RRG08_041755 [Elysia crispata]